MAVRVSPDEYFMQAENADYMKKGIILGACLVIIGVIIGGMLVYFARKG